MLRVPSEITKLDFAMERDVAHATHGAQIGRQFMVDRPVCVEDPNFSAAKLRVRFCITDSVLICAFTSPVRERIGD